ncbi:MAG: ATP-binding cassette domain-containing protein [Lachnospiraceae bacterium]|nr:ATP-binding cassette domain-containing protein [Lachnospiraceae bacterium]
MQNSDLKIYDGEFLLACGISGSGKTTFLKMLKEKYGDKAAVVCQNASAGIVCDKVWQELAFGLENRGYSQDYMRRKVGEMTSFFGLDDVFMKKTSELSGGQKQLVLLASVMACEPEIILLDEPTSELDPLSADRFISSLEKIRHEIGTTIVMTEHRFSGTLHLADRMVALSDMEITAEGRPEDVIRTLYETGDPLFKSMPVYVKMFFEADAGGTMPVDVNSGRAFFASAEDKCRAWIAKNYGGQWLAENASSDSNKTHKKKPAPSVKLTELSFGYEGKKDILKDISLEFPQASVSVLLGGNGSGKSTLLSVIAGTLNSYTGKVSAVGDGIIMLPQDPRLMFFDVSIGEDLKNFRKTVGGIDEAKMEEYIKLCRVGSLLDKHPYDVSGGEIQRAALLKALISGADIILMDEPTKGTEGDFKEEMAEILNRLKEEGKTIIISGHDLEFAALYADYCGLLFNGDITELLPAVDFFTGNTFYTSDVLRIQRGAGGSGKNNVVGKAVGTCGSRPEIPAEERKSIGKESVGNLKKMKALMWFTVCFLMPLTVCIGAFFLDNRKYYFISMLLLLELMIPLYTLFESGRPTTIRLVVIAVMSALAVIGRGLFIMLPAIKPVIAIVMMSGFAFGSAYGLAVGAVSMLVSNIFFGQGPWTPYQMFTFGLIGLIAGMFAGNRKFTDNRFFLAAIGVFMTLVVFGGIMNPASIVMFYDKPTMAMIGTAYATGFPIDCISAVATAAFLVLGTKPVLERCDRVKRYL